MKEEDLLASLMEEMDMDDDMWNLIRSKL
jgi:hypothetical protein